MPKFNGSGKLKKKLKKTDYKLDKRQLEYSQSDFEKYGYVTKEFGQCRFEIELQDKTKRNCKLMRSLRSGIKIVIGSLVLITTETCSNEYGYIIHIYSNRERNKLIKENVIKGEIILEDEDGNIEFEYDNEYDNDDDDEADDEFIGELDEGEKVKSKVSISKKEIVEITSHSDDDVDFDDI